MCNKFYCVSRIHRNYRYCSGRYKYTTVYIHQRSCDFTLSKRNNISGINCFRHGSYVKTEEEEKEEEDFIDKTYEDWMDVERDLQTSEEYPEE